MFEVILPVPFGFQSLSGLSLGLNDCEDVSCVLWCVSIPFRAVTGFEPDGIWRSVAGRVGVSIPFRAVTGFEHEYNAYDGLPNAGSFNPFQGCHWV